MTFAVAANEKGEKVLTMSKEYIEREKALEKVIEVKHHDPELSGVVLHRYIKEIDLKDIPAADVAPVVHGRWVFGKDLACCWGQILKNKHHLYCSECLEQAFNRSEDNDPDFDVDTSYCHNCGCRMDGGNDE